MRPNAAARRVSLAVSKISLVGSVDQPPALQIKLFKSSYPGVLYAPPNGWTPDPVTGAVTFDPEPVNDPNAGLLLPDPTILSDPMGERLGVGVQRAPRTR